MTKLPITVCVEGPITHETLGGSRLDRVEESVARGIDRGTDTVGNSYEDLNGVKSWTIRREPAPGALSRKRALGPEGNSRGNEMKLDR